LAFVSLVETVSFDKRDDVNCQAGDVPGKRHRAGQTPSVKQDEPDGNRAPL
jgi:hypothetical protein